MTDQIMARVQLALVGGFGGLLLWVAIEASEREWIGDYASLVLVGFILTLFGGLLAMAGPLGLLRAVPRALGLAVVAAALVWLTKLRFAGVDDFFFRSPTQVLAGLTVATLPVPFLIAAAKSGWRDYPALFMEAWSITLRFAAAGAFTGLVWLVIYLSDEVLRIVGIEVIRDLLQHEVVPLVLSGAVLGLGLAVVYDLAELLSPYVVLRLFRLFLPLVLAVMVIFLVALPFRGFEGLVSGLSPAMLLLTMAAGGIALVSIAVDQSDAEATESPVLVRATQGMALLLPIIAALALWAIWLRVGDYGWTPERVFIVAVAVVGIGYGLVYALAVVRGAGWMERIRQGNIWMALGVVGLAALWMTPVLNAERISAQSQLARFEAGVVPVEELDVYALRSWGKPGAAVIAVLEAKAKEPGQEALAKLLSGESAPSTADRDALARRLAGLMPVQPASATATRDLLLGAAEPYMLEDWLLVCETDVPEGSPPCVLVVADLLPLLPGEEAMLFLGRSADYTEIAGLYLDDRGLLQYRQVARPDGAPIDSAEAARLMRQYQTTPPPVTAALVNQLGTGESGLIIHP
ncbi:DUF4153 domain-containing protein [Tabrizicola sp.]|uniref:DUF4153 domain-containing protein n=1 Tax=Tabrizicola sp. TaxID=2005166 RepID=UPI003F2E5BB1